MKTPIYNLNFQNKPLRYCIVKNTVWFIVADICKILGSNLDNIYKKYNLEFKIVKIFKHKVKCIDLIGVEKILVYSNSPFVFSLEEEIKLICDNYLNKLKKSLIAKGFLFNFCYVCCLEEWNGKPIPLIMGKENKYLICYNCFNQSNLLFLNSCRNCEREIPNCKKMCLKCKSFKPDKKVLKNDLIKYGLKEVQKKYNVSREIIISWMNK